MTRKVVSVVVCLVSVVAVVAVSGVFRRRTKIFISPLPPNAPVERYLEPDSVILGGVTSKAQIVDALYDPVIRQHYAGIAVEKLQPFILQQDLVAYVSYRLGNQIYWKQAVIHKGEVVLCDGKNLIRARCGNIILLPPDSDLGPTAAAFPPEDAVPPPDPPPAQNTPVSDDGGQIPTTPAPAPTTTGQPPSGPVGTPGFWVAAAPPSSPVVSIPEPGAFELLLSALAVLLVIQIVQRASS